MGHKGITEFMRISQAAVEQGIEVLPHATIGTGIFLAASLQASLALKGIVGHEFQHSVINRNHGLITDGIECSNGAYRFADSAGIGVEPTDKLIAALARL